MNDVPKYKDRPNGQKAAGDPAFKNLIAIQWDPDTQEVMLDFKPAEFKTWDFVLAVLEMAKTYAEQRRKEAVMVAMQKAAMQAQANREIALAAAHPAILRG